MKKMVLALVTSLFSTSALAAGGFTWLGGIAHSLNIPQHTVTFAFVCILFLVGGFIYRAKASSVDTGIVPDKGISFRNIYESIGEFLYDLAKSILGEKDAKKYFTLLITIFLLIFANNLIGIIPGFLPPTDNLNTTLALALVDQDRALRALLSERLTRFAETAMAHDVDAGQAVGLDERAVLTAR